MQTLCDKITRLRELGSKGGEEEKFAAARYYVVEAKAMLKQTK